MMTSKRSPGVIVRDVFDRRRKQAPSVPMTVNGAPLDIVSTYERVLDPSSIRKRYLPCSTFYGHTFPFTSTTSP